MICPVRHRFTAPGTTQRIVDSSLVGLQLLDESGVEVDAVLLTRFDLLHREPLLQLPLHWTKVNVAWPDGRVYWEKERRVSDLFFVIPPRFLPAFRRALQWSGERMQRLKTRNRGFTAGHWVWQSLATEIGNRSLRFIDNRHMSSDSKAICETQPSTAFVRVLRHCVRDCSQWSMRANCSEQNISAGRKVKAWTAVNRTLRWTLHEP